MHKFHKDRLLKYFYIYCPDNMGFLLEQVFKHDLCTGERKVYGLVLSMLDNWRISSILLKFCRTRGLAANVAQNSFLTSESDVLECILKESKNLKHTIAMLWAISRCSYEVSQWVSATNSPWSQASLCFFKTKLPPYGIQDSIRYYGIHKDSIIRYSYVSYKDSCANACCSECWKYTSVKISLYFS